MATRKQPAAAPRAITSKERHPLLARQKASLVKKLGLTRMEILFETVDLAWCLVALGREEEADEIVSWIAAGIRFTGNQNLWSPTGSAICLAARIARLSGDRGGHGARIARLVEHPAYAVVPRSALDDRVAALGRDIDSVATEKSAKWACHKLCRALQGLTYFRETTGSGFYYDGWLDLERLDAEIARALGGLAERLGPTPAR